MNCKFKMATLKTSEKFIELSPVITFYIKFQQVGIIIIVTYMSIFYNYKFFLNNNIYQDLIYSII